MAGASLLTLLDDIAAVLDDVAVMTKVAAKKSAAVADDVATMTKVATKKTAGVLGDDLALNAQQVSGVRADRELSVVWAVAKGSARNKLILVPVALLISVFLPWLVTPLLMLGGAYLCFEGAEKLVHKFLHKEDTKARQAEHKEVIANPAVDPVEAEKTKIKGAVRTDFILSGEIIVIALGTVTEASVWMKLAVLVGISVIMTVGVYGLVAGIVKLDDAGLYLSQKTGPARALGKALLLGAPWLMKTLSFVGTAAMFMVGGGILTHGIPGAEGVIHHLAHMADGVPVAGAVLAAIGPTLLNLIAGLVAGGLIVLVVETVKRVAGKGKAEAGTSAS